MQRDVHLDFIFFFIMHAGMISFKLNLVALLKYFNTFFTFKDFSFGFVLIGLGNNLIQSSRVGWN